MAAENCRWPPASPPTVPRFNEAAANGRGKRPIPRGSRSTRTRFNEAAANGRGKPFTDLHDSALAAGLQ